MRPRRGLAYRFSTTVRSFDAHWMARLTAPACATLLAWSVLQTPHWNFDVVAYAGAARVWLGQAPEQAHAEVYRELALAAPPEAEEAIRSLSEYREGVAGSVDQFRVQIPMYTNKPLYVGLTAALVGLGADSILAPFWVSAASYGGFALLLLLCLRRVTSRWSSWMIGLPLLLSPAFRHVGQEPTPDALSACILLGGLYALAFGGRVLIGAMLLLLSIAARPDNVILCVAIAGWWWWKAPTQRPLAAIGAFASVVAYMVVNRVTGAYSWGVLFTHTFLRRLSDFESISSDVTPAAWSSTLLPGLAGENVLYPSVVLLFLVISVLGLIAAGRSPGPDARTALELQAAIWCAAVLHFLAFPLLADRFYIVHYAAITVLSLLVIDSKVPQPYRATDPVGPMSAPSPRRATVLPFHTGPGWSHVRRTSRS